MLRSCPRSSSGVSGLPQPAQRLREDPSLTVASYMAAELGDADRAHLTADFRQVLGLPPSPYRQQIISDRQDLSDR